MKEAVGESKKEKRRERERERERVRPTFIIRENEVRHSIASISDCTKPSNFSTSTEVKPAGHLYRCLGRRQLEREVESLRKINGQEGRVMRACSHQGFWHRHSTVLNIEYIYTLSVNIFGMGSRFIALAMR